jgi:hypothetical protein
MVIQFGYITMFASAFPFGAFMSYLFTYIEIKSDIFKLERNTKRPISRMTNNIGTWENVM